MALENLGFKVYFNRDVEKKENRKANERLCKITDEKGKEVPSVVIFDPKHKNVMMVLADTQNKKTKIKGETEYTLTIEEGFKGNDGSTMGKYTSSFKTLNPGTSMKISMGMMALMFGGMIFFATKEKKKEQEKNSPKKNTDSGMILAGNKADLIVLDIDSLNMQPEISLTNNFGLFRFGRPGGTDYG